MKKAAQEAFLKAEEGIKNLLKDKPFNIKLGFPLVYFIFIDSNERTS